MTDESLTSDTLVMAVPLPWERDIEVSRVSGSWSPHIPEKKPSFEISHRRCGPSRLYTRIVQEVRLSQVPAGTKIIVEQPVAQRRRCLKWKDTVHAIVKEEYRAILTVCGLDVYTPCNGGYEEYFEKMPPTCQKCLDVGRYWFPYTVLKYDDPRVLERQEHKVKAKARVRARLPTVFDRLLQTDLLNPPPKHIERPSPPEPDPFEDLDFTMREAKLDSRRERARRYRKG